MLFSAVHAAPGRALLSQNHPHCCAVDFAHCQIEGVSAGGVARPPGEGCMAVAGVPWLWDEDITEQASTRIVGGCAAPAAVPLFVSVRHGLLDVSMNLFVSTLSMRRDHRNVDPWGPGMFPGTLFGVVGHRPLNAVCSFRGRGGGGRVFTPFFLCTPDPTAISPYGHG